jgi:hypothetical protein
VSGRQSARHCSQTAEPRVPPVKPDASGPTCLGFNGRFPTDQAPTLQIQGIAPEHTASEGSIIAPDKWLYAEQKGLLMRKPGKAQETARQAMAFYLSLSNYRNIWKRLGFTGAAIGSLTQIVAWAIETAVVPEAEIPIRRRVIPGGACPAGPANAGFSRVRSSWFSSSKRTW